MQVYRAISVGGWIGFGDHPLTRTNPDIHAARLMPASAELNDGLVAAIDLMFRGEVIDIVIALEAVREDLERLVDQPVVKR